MRVLILALLLVISCLTLKGILLGIAIGIFGGAIAIIFALYIAMILMFGRGRR